MTSAAEKSAPRIAVVGAGPIGIEVALEAAARGFDVVLYDAGRIAESMRRFDWVPLFTPFSMNSTARGRASLEAAGTPLPVPDAILPAGELVARYLEPLTRLPALAGRVRERSRVSTIGREGLRKGDGIVSVGDTARVGRPFLLRVETDGEAPRFERADVVVDASGVYGSPRSTGPAGLPALGEETLGDRLERHIAPISGVGRPRYARRRVLLVGDGYSAATALLDFAALADGGDAAEVTWVRPPSSAGDPIAVETGDPLAERAALGMKANRIARSSSWLTHRPGAVIESYELRDGAVQVTLRDPGGAADFVDVDRILALVGYMPDTSIYRELQIHLCYASEGPMTLASAVLAASLAAPDVGGDCLKQVSHGAETLKNPEPDFYIVGSKSYGRNPHFFLALGHQQVADIVDLIEASRAIAAAPSIR